MLDEPLITLSNLPYKVSINESNHVWIETSVNP